MLLKSCNNSSLNLPLKCHSVGLLHAIPNWHLEHGLLLLLHASNISPAPKHYLHLELENLKLEKAGVYRANFNSWFVRGFSLR